MTRTVQKEEHSSRRSNGDGSVTQDRKLANGENVYQWRIRVKLPTGQTKRLTGTFQGRSKQEAREAMYAAKTAAENGSAPQATRSMTIGDLLSEWMEQGRVYDGVRPRTLQLQSDLIRLHILPRIGDWTVAALNPTLLEEYHRTLIKETKLTRSRAQIHSLLNQALSYAVRRGYLIANPLREVKLPKRPQIMGAAAQTTIKAWTPEQAGQLAEAALKDGSVFAYAIVFALRTGLRLGEVFGLRWECVDLTEGWLKVEEVLSTHGPLSRSITSPKTTQSCRKIKLGRSALECLDHLKAAQTEQGHPDADYVFATREGTMQHPNNVNRTLKRLLTKAGLPRYSFHSLRHTFVSIAAHQNWSIKAVSVYVGHANTVITQTTYMHLWPEHQEAIELDL
ncbi:site-specific integrase [Deinococcus psychrotolerans]|uniref:Site-specific integrase n=1 Tax=Deinococcus psychrotolerans TaxID=2489213 RepID=A0A3G8YGW0_9DEIO|nr:site-specific integrase [Deinococcus psychrotolerans]AZI43427.1 site-specific integrase [Deinococcus psychrotolerans]